jgi:hypothetical protein
VWLAHNVIPDLHRADVWRQPLVAGAFDATLRARMLAAVTALPRLLDELDTVPAATAHGDACTRNLLITDTDDTFAMIDFGFWGTAPVGFDLGQLLLGEVQLGNRPAGPLPLLENACLRAYVNGLHDEGDDTTLGQVRRSHAMLMTIYHAIPAIPYEHRTATPTAQPANSTPNEPPRPGSSWTCWTAPTVRDRRTRRRTPRPASAPDLWPPDSQRHRGQDPAGAPRRPVTSWVVSSARSAAGKCVRNAAVAVVS